MGKNTKIWRKVLLRIALAIMLIITVPPVLVSIPWVQNQVKTILVNIAEKRLGTQVEIGWVEVRWFLDLKVNDILIKDQADRDMLRIDALRMDVNTLSLRNQVLEIKEITLNRPEFILLREEGAEYTNFTSILSILQSEDTTSAEPWLIRLHAVKINNGFFDFDDENYVPIPEGIDFKHVGLDSVFIELADYHASGDTNFFRIEYLSLQEQSGFEVDSFSGAFRLSNTELDALGLKFRTPATRMDMDVNFAFNNWLSFNDFIDSVYMQASMRPSRLLMSDIGYFAPEMFSMTNRINLSGDVRGLVSGLKARNLAVDFGNATSLLTDVDMTGLPDIMETFVDIEFKRFDVLADDIERFGLPGNSRIAPLPEMLYRLGLVSTRGMFTGFYNDFVAEASFDTQLGRIETDLVLRQGFEGEGLSYSGDIKALPFNLGKLLNTENIVGRMILDMDISGSGLDWTSLDMAMEGVVDSLELLGENFNNIAINGGVTGKRFSGQFRIDDELLALDFNGEVDLREDRPRFDFIADVEHARIDRLSNEAVNQELWGEGLVMMNFSGSDLDRLEGRVEVEGLSLKDTMRQFNSRNLMLSFEPDSQRYKTVRLRSDFADADLNGSFTFGSIYQYFAKQLRDLLPSLNWEGEVPLPDSTMYAEILLDVYNTDNITGIFLPQLKLYPGSRLEVDIQKGSQVTDWELNIPSIAYNDYEVSDVRANGSVLDEELRSTLHFTSVVLTDSIYLNDLEILAKLREDSLGYLMRWKTAQGDSLLRGMFRGRAMLPDTGVLSLRLEESQIPLDGAVWSFNTDHRIIIDSGGVSFNNLSLASANHFIRLNGRADRKPASQLGLQFNNFDLDLVNVFLGSSGIELDGMVNGDLTLMAALGVPRGYSVLKIRDFTFNKDTLGDASVNAAWEPDLQRLRTDARIIYQGNAGVNYPLEITGFIYPEEEYNNFDLDMGLKNLKLTTFQPYLTSLTSSVSGFLSGDMRLEGSFDNPELSGELTARRASLKLDYLNVEYSFTHTIDVSPGAFLVKDLVLNDPNGKQAICNGGIFHEGFRDLRVDLEIRPTDFSVLNTTLAQNELFYGNASATGIARISGPFDDLSIEINASTGQGTKMTIPISYDAEVAERGFITFVDKDKDTAQVEESVDLSGIRLDFNLDATPDADVMIELPMRMGRIKGNGSGDIRFLIDTRGEFSMFGDYTISSGYYDMTLQNLLNRRFQIRQGGTISWNGDPYDARLNMTAVYPVRAGLSALRPVGDSSDLYNQRIPVNCIIRLTDRLVSPGIDFSFELPESSEDVNRLIFSSIDTTNEALVSRQMISLLVLNSFISEESGVNLAGGVSSSSFDLISRQLSNWLSQISKDFDVGVNYRPGDALTNEELEVALSTQLFNDRVLIDGNLGLAGDKNSQAASSLVGDVVVEVKLTDDGRFRVKAFNKSNYVDLIDNKAPYTQGVGIFYRKEFDSLDEIFNRQRRPQ